MSNVAPTTQTETIAPADTPAIADAPVKNKFATMKKRKKWPKWIKLTIFLVIVAAVAVGAFLLIRKLVAKDQGEVFTAFAYRGMLSSTVTGWGNVTPKTKADYGQDVQGTVLEVAVNAGDLVMPGDLLFTIDPTDLLAELESANQRLNEAAAALNEAIENLGKTTLNAPFTGKLIDADAFSQGQEVIAGQIVGLMIDDSKMRLSLYFSHAYIDTIKAGMPIEVSVPDNMVVVSGTVASIDRINKPLDGAMVFRVNVVLQNPGTLVEGLAASGMMTVGGMEILPAQGGILEYFDKQPVAFEMGGKLSYSGIMDYGEYTGGQVLASISNASLQPAVDAAQKVYDEALERVNKLNDAIQNVDVVCEIEGMVTAVMIKPGDKLTASGTAVITVSNTAELIVEINIDELDISKVSVGMPVDIMYDSSEGQGWMLGELIYVSFEASRSQGDGWNSGAVAYFPAKIAIENTGTLLPNMGVNYSIMSVLKEDCLLVPSTSIMYTEAGAVVFVRDDGLHDYARVELPEGTVPDGFYAVAVEVGIGDAYNTEIVSGIDDGTEVYSSTAVNWDSIYPGSIF